MNTLEISIDRLNVLDGERLVKTVKPRIFLQLLLIGFQFLTQFSHRPFIFFGNFDLSGSLHQMPSDSTPLTIF